ncbi:hypothetical protein OPV22_010284 [Ensete ventricosum]|uniref:USP domain-containing protein n=1 Tax=Ensete ventricosum TaxID=4639 RepID=A0AAV8RFB2_ENSVE|nr:hypothetical protein OPV22_010284 [Ensete ventricosum]
MGFLPASFAIPWSLQTPCLSCPVDEVHSKYDLYAVLLHIGSLGSGHYFCCIRSSPSTWHCINDSKVYRVSESDVLAQDAYLLFLCKATIVVLVFELNGGN